MWPLALATLLGTRVAGNRSNTNSDFTFDYSGDNGSAAASAQLSYPTGIAVDAAGNVFFADSANNVIREAVAGK